MMTWHIAADLLAILLGVAVAAALILWRRAARLLRRAEDAERIVYRMMDHATGDSCEHCPPAGGPCAVCGRVA